MCSCPSNDTNSLKNMAFFKTGLGKIISILIVQYFIFLAWIPFRVTEFDKMAYSIQKYIFWDFAFTDVIDIALVNKIPIILMLGFFILHLISYKKINLLQTISNLKLKYWFIILILITSLILLFYDLNPHDFIYFRF